MSRVTTVHLRPTGSVLLLIVAGVPAVAATAFSIESFDGFGAGPMIGAVLVNALALAGSGAALGAVVGAPSGTVGGRLRAVPVGAGLAVFLLSVALGAILPAFADWSGGAVWPAGAVWMLVVVTGALAARARSVVDGAIIGAAALLAILSPLPLAARDPGTLTVLLVCITLALAVSIALGVQRRRTEERLQQMTVTVRNAERASMARELHDVVAHEVAGIAVLAQAGTAAGKADATLLMKIEQSSGRALADIRSLVVALRDPDSSAVVTAPTGSTAQALRDLVSHFAEDFPAPVTSSVSDDVDEALPDVVLLAAHRFMSESLTNIRRHAADTRWVDIAARVADRRLIIEVVNEVPSESSTLRGAGPGTGSGLDGLRERARSVGGKVDVVSAEQQWSVHAELPVDVGR